MKTAEMAAAAAATVDLAAWEDIAQLSAVFAGRFPRVKSRQHTGRFIRSLITGLPRMNCWTLAEQAGYPNPDAFQDLLSRAIWDHEGVRDDLRASVVEHLGIHRSVRLLDETDDVMKDTHTVDTQHQYTGTVGRIEKAQLPSSGMGNATWHASIDRGLYVPASWTEDRTAGRPL